MEAAEIILGGECEGGFDYSGNETQTTFTLTESGEADPVEAVVRFLVAAKVIVVMPRKTSLSIEKWKLPTEQKSDDDPVFPGRPTDSATLPIVLRSNGIELPIEYWLDGDLSGRDNVKFWAGAQGKPGAAFALDALEALRELGANSVREIAANPFSFEAPMSGSLRFDWRRDYIPLEAGFSPNAHKGGRTPILMIGYPLVELLAAVGMQNARPARVAEHDKLAYRYGVSSARLPTMFVRTMIGAQWLGFAMRRFRMRLGWPGQEGQARCIIDAEEEAEHV
jgi:CRISPR-associated protein Csx14